MSRFSDKSMEPSNFISDVTEFLEMTEKCTHLVKESDVLVDLLELKAIEKKKDHTNLCS